MGQHVAWFAVLLAASCVIHSAMSFSGKAMEMAKEVDRDCRTQTGAKEGSFWKFIQGDDGAFSEIDEIYKCFLKCVMNKLDSLSHEGEYDMEAEFENVPPEILEEGHRMIRVCQSTTGNGACDTAFQMHKCYHRENPELYKEVIHHWDRLAGNEN